MFETRMPRNRASRHDPNVIVSTPNTSRIPFGTVTVFARRMLAYERLDRRAALAPAPPGAARPRPRSAPSGRSRLLSRCADLTPTQTR